MDVTRPVPELVELTTVVVAGRTVVVVTRGAVVVGTLVVAGALVVLGAMATPVAAEAAASAGFAVPDATEVVPVPLATAITPTRPTRAAAEAPAAARRERRAGWRRRK
ncbi:MAG: hypothetical protein ACOYOP_11115 [Microthrixaceae bacterium]